jgi:hypothetical protein
MCAHRANRASRAIGRARHLIRFVHQFPPGFSYHSDTGAAGSIDFHELLFRGKESSGNVIPDCGKPATVFSSSAG